MPELDRLSEMLIRHEGLKLKPYRCPAGKLTIGVGRNLDDVGISKSEALGLLANDIEHARSQAVAFPWFMGLSPVRKDVVISMVFNLGLAGFSEFKAMIAALAISDYQRAAAEMEASRWASQVGERAKELAELMRTGLYP